MYHRELFSAVERYGGIKERKDQKSRESARIKKKNDPYPARLITGPFISLVFKPAEYASFPFLILLSSPCIYMYTYTRLIIPLVPRGYRGERSVGRGMTS